MRAFVILLCLWGILAITPAAEISSAVVDRSGAPLVGILVHVTSGDGSDKRSVRTGDDGAFSITVPDGKWEVLVDASELLERGYFCLPGWCCTEIPPTLFAVPLVPELEFIMPGSRETAPALQAVFDWLPGLEPTVFRCFRIERSTDMKTWEPFAEISLADPPLAIPDPEAVPGIPTYYRWVEMPNITGTVRTVTQTRSTGSGGSRVIVVPINPWDPDSQPADGELDEDFR